jgi:osmotically-inducible protein OsmY
MNPQSPIADLAERLLRSNPYLALKNVSCDWLDGVLILRGCLPSFYLKQITQEVVASVEGVEHIDNQILVVTPAYPSRIPDQDLKPEEKLSSPCVREEEGHE